MATVERAYDIQEQFGNSFFLFDSIGEKGLIKKFVWFQATGKENEFNLAFGDFDEGRLNDKNITNNNDPFEVISTVVKCVHEFIKAFPGAVIHIIPVDDKRAVLYNYVFRNRAAEFGQQFLIEGINEKGQEEYQREKFYTAFVLKHII